MVSCGTSMEIHDCRPWRDPSSICKNMQGRNGLEVGVSAITLVEILYLSEKGRIPIDAFNDVMVLLERPNAAFVEIAFDRSISRSMERILRSDVPDMPDRIIAATALHLSLPVISRDGRIRALNIETIW